MSAPQYFSRTNILIVSQTWHDIHLGEIVDGLKVTYYRQVDRVSRDVRYAARSLRKSPAFAATAILTLALGIGANTAIFSALEGVVLAPLPYRQPDRLVMVLLYNRALKYSTYLSYPDFLDWQREARSFEQMAAFQPVGFDLTSPGPPEHVDGR